MHAGMGSLSNRWIAGAGGLNGSQRTPVQELWQCLKVVVWTFKACVTCGGGFGIQGLFHRVHNLLGTHRPGSSLEDRVPWHSTLHGLNQGVYYGWLLRIQTGWGLPARRSCPQHLVSQEVRGAGVVCQGAQALDPATAHTGDAPGCPAEGTCLPKEPKQQSFCRR